MLMSPNTLNDLARNGVDDVDDTRFIGSDEMDSVCVVSNGNHATHLSLDYYGAARRVSFRSWRAA